MMTFVALGLAVALVGAVGLLWRLRAEHMALQYELERALRVEAGSFETQRPELLWHRAIFKHVNLGLIVTDAEKNLLAVNPTAEQYFGAGVSGSSAITLLRHHVLEGLLDEALAGQIDIDQVVSTGTREMQTSAVCWGEGETVGGAVLVLQDVTARQRLARARRDFAANISHELRTPLATLKILIETLQSVVLENPPLAERLVTKSARETEAMIRLVEDMTALALIESGRTPLALEPTPLAALVHDRVTRLAPYAGLKGVVLHEHIPPELTPLLDPERFGQVLTNLFDNAIKFTPEGGEVTVRAQATLEQVRLEVEDSGPGIAPDDLPRVFERFYKSDTSRDRSASGDRGTGLGLAIAKHLVEAHGGSIWAESPPGRGAIFVITLPTERALAASSGG